MDQIEATIPFLRRYARAATGNRASADELVAVMLEKISESDPDPHEPGLRCHLYSVLDAHLVTRFPDAGADATRLLASSERRALLLTELENFSVADVATIMGKPEVEVLDLLLAARQKEASALPTDVYIIEDEALIAVHIANIVHGMGHTVIGTASEARAAMTACQDLRPGLILSDVILNEEASGADVATEIASLYGIPVVFITAFPHALLRGETGEPTFLVEKPFTPKTIKAVIGQALLQSRVQPTG
ncbi:MAG: response regulator [Henriciella sp.]|uniref:response regulator n=1 Tax=Henriciella sp. TaxID=1968823 RepID=UPI0032EB685C